MSEQRFEALPPANHAPEISHTPEILTSGELAARLKLPETWIRDQVRSRAVDPMPCARFGKYVRFNLDDQKLKQWLRRRGMNL